ncbi:rRNA N6-adenosine-methyltransferase Mettl5 [Anopheles bellator]|uniref:rRNA N6-adenosine-methyltransferase Mettl5 n=1 Tax=Anopheles bellator TaxID=139047 RepID=UPI0026476E1F|nr:rRNA N6-adenosine-methyltransferase Mettl5 [Anopheles bellator]
MACIKLKKLETFLQSVDDFVKLKVKVKLEQYMTPPHIASQVLYDIQTKFKDLEDRSVLDLGCGSGMLSIGAALLGASYVIGAEIDPDAVEIFLKNCTEFELANIDCVQVDVLQLETLFGVGQFDIVLMNPPFGTKQNSGIDMAFLHVGIKLARCAVYSMHKSSTRDFIRKKVAQWNVKGTVLAELRYNLESTYKFHKRSSVDVAVDLWRFDLLSGGRVDSIEATTKAVV